ncbi:MAG: hypothetical protein IKL96_00530, partial [Kiritimatiellae bacterium]|nr:hypothetical protein [Kiritimatiellia bacterium]
MLVMADGRAELLYALDCGAQVPFSLSDGALGTVTVSCAPPDFQTFKPSNSQTFKLSNFQTFRFPPAEAVFRRLWIFRKFFRFSACAARGDLIHYAPVR